MPQNIPIFADPHSPSQIALQPRPTPTQGEMETIEVELPTGEVFDAEIPSGLSDDAARSYLTSRNPSLFAHGSTPESILPSPRDTQMQRSLLPGMVRGSLGALPVAGGFGGAALGAPAFGGGAVVGGALGAAAGNTAKQALEQTIFATEKEPGISPLSQEGLLETGLVGVMGGALEVPGAIATSMGRGLMTKMARTAKAAGETGDVKRGLELAAPRNLSSKGIKDSILKKREEVGTKFGALLKFNQGRTVNFDDFLESPLLEAELVAIKEPSLKGVLPIVRRAIASAKLKSGIEVGNPATPEQVWAFQKELQAVFSKEPTAATAATASQVNEILRRTYTQAGEVLRTQIPKDAGRLLQQLKDLHAAEAGLRYGLRRIGSATVSAAASPRTTALLSPFPTALVAADIAIEGPGTRATKGVLRTLSRVSE